MSERKPYHRRTLDEDCVVRQAAPGEWCIDQRIRETCEATKNLHRYQP